MAIYTIREGVLDHPEESVLQHLSTVLKKSGLADDGDMTVGEHSAGGLNVDVSTGVAYIKGTSVGRPVRISATETVAINSNSSGNPRITDIVLYIDKSVTPASPTNDGGIGIAKLTSVDGTPASSPIAPSDSTIQSAVGTGNPYLVLAEVMVADGATGISASDISNTATRAYLKSPKYIYDNTSSATLSIDYNNSDMQSMTLTSDTTVTVSNMQIGDWLVLSLIQDSTGGWSVTWFSGITWLSADYSLATSANQKSVFAFRKTGTSSYEGYLIGKEY